MKKFALIPVCGILSACASGGGGGNRLEINYYGDGNNATEFTGTTLYNDNEIEMNVGFGGVLNK